MTEAYHTEDLVDGRVGGQRAVENGELTFETLWDVVAAAARLNHGSHKLGGKSGETCYFFGQQLQKK